MSSVKASERNLGNAIVTGGKYIGMSGIIVNRFPTSVLMKVKPTSIGGRFQPYYNGHIIKVRHIHLKEQSV